MNEIETKMLIILLKNDMEQIKRKNGANIVVGSSSKCEFNDKDAENIKFIGRKLQVKIQGREFQNQM